MYVSDPQASKRSTNTHQSKHDRPPTSSPSYASNASMGLKGTQVTHHPSRFSHQFLMMMIFIIRSVEILLNRNFSHAGFQILMTLSTQMLGLGLAGLTRRQVIPSYPRVPHLKPSNWHHSPWIGRQLRILVYPPMMVWPASLASVGRYLNPVAQEFFSGLSKFGVSDSTLGYGFMSQKHWTMCSTKSIILLPIVGRSVVIISLWSSLWYESFFFLFFFFFFWERFKMYPTYWLYQLISSRAMDFTLYSPMLSCPSWVPSTGWHGSVPAASTWRLSLDRSQVLDC